MFSVCLAFSFYDYILPSLKGFFKSLKGFYGQHQDSLFILDI